MQDIDRKAMGLRIKSIRQDSGLRQWELARLLGTTQSAVHKYEHGIVPEPRRLLEIARIGDTSVEWILTGHHGEGGRSDRERIPGDVVRTAESLHRLHALDRHRLDEALRLLEEAARGGGDPISGEVAELLAVARDVRDRVVSLVLRQARDRIAATERTEPPEPADGPSR